MPKVSVIIPTYNSATTIVEALESVNSQTVTDYEVIVVDDASSDDTVNVVNESIKHLAEAPSSRDFATPRGRRRAQSEVKSVSHRGTEGTERKGMEPQMNADGLRCEGNKEIEQKITKYTKPKAWETEEEGKGGRYRIIELSANLGPAGARNAGIKEAKGEWIAFLDGDDAWYPWRLESQFEALKLFPDAGLLSGNVEMDWEENTEKPEISKEACTLVSLVDFVDDNPVATSTVLVRKDITDKVGGFDEQFRGPEDVDLWMRIATVGQIISMNVPLSMYRERPGSLCMDSERFLPQVLKVYDKTYAEGGALHEFKHLKNRTLASRYASAAWTDYACGNKRRAINLLMKSWVVWPRRIKPEFRQPLWRLAILFRIIFNVK